MQYVVYKKIKQTIVKGCKQRTAYILARILSVSFLKSFFLKNKIYEISCGVTLVHDKQPEIVVCVCIYIYVFNKVVFDFTTTTL